MSVRLSDSRPTLWREPSSSSSLEGMEKPWPSRPSTPRTPRVESIINMYMEKPLPLTPRQLKLPSSPLKLVSTEAPHPPRTPMKEEALSSKLFRKVSLKRSSASRVPDTLALRQHLDKDVRLRSKGISINRSSLDLSLKGGRPANPQVKFPEIHPGTRVRTPDPSKEPHFCEWKAPIYRPPERRIVAVPPKPSKLSEERNWRDRKRNASGEKTWEMIEREHGSRPQAEEYRALLHDISLESPESSANPIKSDSDFEPSPMSPIQTEPDIGQPKAMSPRIIDVLDQPLVPEILDVSSHEAEAEQRPPSQFSEDSENSQGTLQYDQKSSRGDKENPFRRRPSSKYPRQREHHDSMIPREELKRSSRRLPSKREHRKSIQQGVSYAYDSLHRKISSSSRARQCKKELAREYRNPAVPLTAYQQYGKKAWESQRSSSKLATFKRKSWLDSSAEPSPNSIQSYRSDTEASGGWQLSHTRGSTDGSIEFSMAPRTNTERPSMKDRFGGKKLASALQHRIAQVEHAIRSNKEKVRLAKKSEERREELRRMIVVVLPKEQAKF
ncbi:MAG: hypothetical protein Q9217_005129 [Psora testacea]